MHSHSAVCFTIFLTLSSELSLTSQRLKIYKLHHMLQEFSPDLTIWSASVPCSFAILISKLKALELHNYQQNNDISPSALKQKENYP